MRRILVVATLLAAIACTPKTSVTSPDGSIVLAFSIADGVPSYSVSVDGQPFIDTSRLGLVAQEADMAQGFVLKGSKLRSHREVWHQPWGENKEITDNHRELVLNLKNAAGVRLDLIFRVFDDGFGFKYAYNVAGVDTVNVTDELTRFNFTADATSWSIPGDFNSYEHLYRKMPLSELRDANTPMTMKFSDQLYASVHEAAIVDFPEMVLKREEGLSFKASLAPLKGGRRRGGVQDSAVKAIKKGSFETPWRTIQISRSAVGLINSSLILNLNEPCAIEDVSWIKPMKYIGVWWSLHLGIESWGGDYHGATTEQALKYIDFAAANNIQGVLFEGWNDAWRGSDALPDFDFTRPAPDYDVEKVAAYAMEKGVTLISHNETGGNFRRFDDQLERSMAWAESLGIHAVKTGYAGGGMNDYVPKHSQTAVNHFQRVIETAAKHRMMVDAHETIKPTGLRRTWPNFMTRECVRGMEYNGWSAGNPPSHHEILPYTRILGGPVDYTPGVFDIEYRSIDGLPQVRGWGRPGTECRVNTTLAKQIANWVVLYSPMQMACDLLQNYDGHPAFQFFRDFNADCDWSRALQGEVGEWIAVVRRARDVFFLGATTDENARTIVQVLDFLAPGKEYTMTVYADAPDADWVSNPYAYQITSRTVTAKDTVTLHLAPGGGAAVTIM
ncbi:MAG: glycoside hydrolase family 97 protein [Bacteroidales bacterium]|nr:glycoside hydrolase family 97 protein [Bacteroidales bacterium]